MDIRASSVKKVGYFGLFELSDLDSYTYTFLQKLTNVKVILVFMGTAWRTLLRIFVYVNLHTQESFVMKVSSCTL